MWETDQLALWSGWTDVLLPHEHARAAEFVELYADQLRALEAPSRPPVAMRYAAQRRAVVIWDYMRTTSAIRKSALARGACLTQTAERGERFADSELRRRLDNLSLDELDAAERFSKSAAGIFDADVQPIRRTG